MAMFLGRPMDHGETEKRRLRMFLLVLTFSIRVVKNQGQKFGQFVFFSESQCSQASVKRPIGFGHGFEVIPDFGSRALGRRVCGVGALFSSIPSNHQKKQTRKERRACSRPAITMRWLPMHFFSIDACPDRVRSGARFPALAKFGAPAMSACACRVLNKI